jgi:hypothetical protein
MKVMDRFPIIITLGARCSAFWPARCSSAIRRLPLVHRELPERGVYVGLACALLVVVLGKWLQRRARGRSSRSTEPSGSAGVRIRCGRRRSPFGRRSKAQFLSLLDRITRLAASAFHDA